MQRRAPLLALAGLVTTLAFSGSAWAQTTLDEVMARKSINIAIPTDFPPYGFVSTDLKPQGLDVDMANYIGAKLGVKVDLVVVTSANRIPYLQTKKADLVISTLGKNAEREKVIEYVFSPTQQRTDSRAKWQAARYVFSPTQQRRDSRAKWQAARRAGPSARRH